MADQQWGRSNRRQRRETARELAKELMHSGASTRRVTGKDWALFAGAVAVAIILLLAAPLLRSDFTGKVLTVILLVAVVLLLIPLIWNFTQSIVIRIACQTIVVALVIILGFRVWPLSLRVKPSDLTLQAQPPIIPNVIKTFTFANKSDDDTYVNEVDFTASDMDLVQDLSFDIPASSKKPLGGENGSERYADIVGGLCRDPMKRPLYILSFEKLAPNESREITFTYTGTRSVSITAETGTFSREPQPVSVTGNKDNAQAGRPFEFSHPILQGSKCRLFSFVLDKKGPVFFGLPSTPPNSK